MSILLLPRTRLVIIGCLLAAAIWRCPAPARAATEADWIPKDPDEFLAKLQAKDAQFDNLSVEFKQRETIHRDPAAEYASDSFNAMRFGGQQQPARPEKFPQPYDVERVSTYRLTIRGLQTTTDFASDTDGRGEPFAKTYTVKETNIGGPLQVLADNVLRIDFRPDDGMGMLYSHRMQTEFALGVGFGKRIGKIKSIQPDGEDAVVDATMRLWRSDEVTNAKLTIDKNLIVRKANLLVDVGGNGMRRYEIVTSTSGLSAGPSGAK
jgi:hypothetical protein